MAHVICQTDENGKVTAVGIERNPPEAFEKAVERYRKEVAQRTLDASGLVPGVVLPEKAATEALKSAAPAPPANPLPALVTEPPSPHKCPHCDFVATSSQGRSAHVRARHPGV